MTASTQAPTPANSLAGRVLKNGHWHVQTLSPRIEGATGGHFSCGYVVRSPSGKVGFLKAMDYTEALQSNDPAITLEAMTAAYNFERRLCEKCNTRKLSRIVRSIDSGKIQVDPSDPNSTVQFIIFELADSDIRTYLDESNKIDSAWILRTMHQATSALRQLHTVKVAHQDIKPSNLLIFDQNESKLGDLGRAFDEEFRSPFDDLICAGDRTYAPPELIYRDAIYSNNSWHRRLACDMYLIGSLLVFFCTGNSMTHILLNRIDNAHHPKKWKGSYEDLVPYLQYEFNRIVREICANTHTFQSCSEDISTLISQLCHPDYKLRGNPKHIGNFARQFALEYYVSKFNLLARRAEYSLM